MSFKGHSAAVYLNVLKCDLFPFCTLAPHTTLRNRKVDLLFITVRNSSCRKVMFSQASVILPTVG